jgi:soluble lytic murein transglycosylase-like protein
MALTTGCRRISEEAAATGAAETVPPPSEDLVSVDSLLMCGRPRPARAVLLERLDNGEIPPGEALVRLVGSYHSRGEEDLALAMLDSLEAEGYGPLWGWKVSVLDMARRDREALARVRGDRPLLRLWLNRDMPDSVRMAGVTVLPAPKNLVERAVRVGLVPAGCLNRRQLELAAEDAALLPSLSERVLDELEKRLYSPGDDWERVFSAAGLEGARADLLRARRMAALGSGRAGLEAMLDAGGEAAAVAAEELLSRWPEEWAESWRVADLLSENGRRDAAASMAELSGGAPEFLAGLRMALLRSDGEYSRLLSLCDSVLDSDGASSELRARAHLYRARAHRARNSSDAAYGGYAGLARRYPEHPTSREAAYLAGKYFDSEQEWAEAADAYLASLRSAGVWEGDSRAHWRGGFCLYMSGRGSLGDSLWRAGVRRYPYSYWRDEMLFWMARYAARRGRGAESRRLLEQVAREHPWEFYGMLAQRRLGLSAPPVPSPAATGVAQSPEGRLAVQLMESGYGAALREILRDGAPGDPMRSARILSLLGETRAAMTLMRRIDTGLRESGEGILPDSMLPFYFPDPYGHLASEAAAELSLSSSILQGIMREESYFDRWVVSWAGARGLIQLMPGTAGDVARWYGLPRLSGEEFYVPENSVRYGALYINRQHEAFDGLEPLYLAAYNAGPGNARRWIDMHGWDPDDPELYIEQITYRETRMYVKKVLRSAWTYEGRDR